MKNNVAAKTVFTSPLHFLAFGFGSGLAPKAPGTFGTLAVVPIYYLLAQTSLEVYLAVTIFICVIGIYLCGESARKLKTHDHPGIVWDEFAGYLITMTAISLTWQNVLIGFILFRIFDIVKPWPIKWADRKVSGGLGIMLDDIIAGLFAWGCLLGINYLWLAS